MSPFFTVVMPSFLGNYKHAAKDRDKKIHRAIKSVLLQTNKSFELFIVADGCDKTFEVAGQYADDIRVKCSLIPKQPYMSGNVRNFGIHHAAGQWIVYLDIDDYWGENHLQVIEKGIYDCWHKPLTYDRELISKQPAWVYFNDWAYDKRKKEFQERVAELDKKHRHGTSNVAHRKDLDVLWKNSSYDHDFVFCNDLKKHQPFYKIATPEYYVCHVPNGWDV